MKLSIITINYNNANGLKKTMESVLAQTSQEFEYIVVDGGSTDGSKEVIMHFANHLTISPSHHLRWLSEPDTGIYNAMNKGIRMAKGEYVQFLNSGDYLVANDVTARMLNFLNIRNQELKTNNEKEISIVYGNMLKVLKDGSVFYNKEIPNVSMLTFFRGTINHSSAYIQKKLFDQYGLYDESLKIVADWKFYLITVGLHNEKLEYADIDMTYFDTSGISNTNSVQDRDERRIVLEALLPPLVLKDYDAYWFDIEQMRRIKRYKLLKWIFWCVERCVFKYEKLKSKYQKEHLFFD